MKCPVCGAAELVHDTRNLPYTFDCEMTTIAAVVGAYCPACGEGVFDAAESSRVSAALLMFRRSKPDEAQSVDCQVGIARGDAGTLNADEIMQPAHAWHRDALRDTERRYEVGHEQPVD